MIFQSMRNFFLPFCLLFICLSCGPRENATKVACVGDSITYGSEISLRNWRSYPAQLQGLLGRDFNVINFGKSGATVLVNSDLSYHVQKELQDALTFEPDIVIIKLGTNDSKEQYQENIRDFYADYLRLINQFKKLPNQPRIIICKPVPIFSPTSSMKKKILSDELLPLIDEISKDAGVELIDLYRPFVNKSVEFPDGVHPNVAGDKMIAAHIHQYLSTNPEPK